MDNLRRQLIQSIISDGGFEKANDLNGYFKEMFKDIIQEMLKEEMSMQLGYEKGDSLNKNTTNRRNGHSKKTVKSKYGNIDIDIPRDRNSDFDPVIIPKTIRDVAGIDDKVNSLCARGMSTRDIHNLYGLEIS